MPVQFRIQGDPRFPIHPLIGCLPMMLILFLMCLLPLVLYDVGRIALGKLGLSPVTATLTVLGIFIGSLVNLPVKEIRRDELQPELPFGPMGMLYPRTYRRVQSRTIIAVNLGGCVIPVALAVMQVFRLARIGPEALLTAGLVSVLSIVVCWRTARPVEGIGIMMPGLIPPLVSVLGTWILLFDATPEQRAATAFVAGVSGPVIGADLFHFRDILRTPVAVMSIGGAGTFDGIVLSGILAALLA
jgi:uncharacterized membrane protein